MSDKVVEKTSDSTPKNQGGDNKSGYLVLIGDHTRFPFSVYKWGSGMEVVVARYKEDIEWTCRLPYKVTVYTKNDGLLPNIGREAHTYLYHIITRWDSLAEHTAFVQGHPFDHAPGLLQDLVETPTEFRHLGPQLSCDRDGWPHHCGLNVGRLADAVGLVQSEFVFSAGAQFVVSRERIRSRPLAFYHVLMSVLVTNLSEAPWVYERLWQSIFMGSHA